MILLCSAVQYTASKATTQARHNQGVSGWQCFDELRAGSWPGNSLLERCEGKGSRNNDKSNSSNIDNNRKRNRRDHVQQQ